MVVVFSARGKRIGKLGSLFRFEGLLRLVLFYVWFFVIKCNNSFLCKIFKTKLARIFRFNESPKVHITLIQRLK